MVCENLYQLETLVKQWKAAGDKVVFTNGVFDILHLGHVEYLEKAKALGHRLVIGVNDDASVKKLNKGSERPINPQYARAAVLAALRCTDAVLIFSEDTPHYLITNLMPDVLVKGGDYDPNEVDANKKSYIVGSQEVKKAGGEVIAIPLVAGFSTTSIVQRLKS